MPYDGSVVSSIVNELQNKLLNGKIDKVYQPEKDELLIHIRSSGDNYKLLLSASSTYPRVHLTEESKSNSSVPPSFCMLLRKHLLGGRIVSVSQPQFERIIEIDIDSSDELGYGTQKTLVAEIMGRHSNIIFIDKTTGKIIDSIKRISFEISSVREILPGGNYEYPPSFGKADPTKATRESLIEGIMNNPGSIMAEKYLVSKFNGISPVLARDICMRAGIDSDADLKQCSSGHIEKFYNAFYKFQEAVRTSSFHPNIVYKDVKALDFSCFDLEIYKNFEKQKFESMSKAVERFYHEKDKKDRIKQKSGDMHKVISNRLERCYKKLEKLNGDLQEASDSEKYKLYGDLIISNIYYLQRGEEKARLQNYYSPEGEYIEIPLDIRLSPSENAQKYYKQYNKFKKAINKINIQLQENKQEIMYLEAQLDNLDKCTEELELEEIRTELAEQGYLKIRRRVKGRQTKKTSSPMRFISSTGFEIFVGKNNVQNDYLTLKLAVNQDIWLHTKDIPGSHVLIKTKGKDVDDTTLKEAANLAAYYSKGRMSSKVPVDYTIKKNVKKPNGAKPGMVIYENYNTIYITPEENVNLMKK
ncbi:MAG: fibronectin/fibrinogen-binding protein [Gracilibacteraceae bacterium]|jgi:predicted ribosome quality control (RQC) complex YloA/Tae2 family protein|nr:fibronectin/fibrinogen-binding protein [Gracilibacteraceae bacterium]